MSDLVPVTDANILNQLNATQVPVTDAKILAQLNATGSAATPDAYLPTNQGASPDTLRPFGLNTGIPLSQDVSNFLAGAGKASNDLVTGIGQATGFGKTSKEEIANAKERDMALMNTKAGMGGNLTGNLVDTLPAMAIPGANTYVGAGLIGAGMGAAQPTTGDWTERAVNTGLGGALSLAGQGAGNLIGMAIKPVKNSLNPEEARLAKIALDNGVPLTAAQQTGSKGLQLLDSAMGDMPLTASEQNARTLAQRMAWQKNMVLGPSGVKGDLATGPALAEAKSRIGSQIGNYSNNYSTELGQGLSAKLDDIATEAANHLPQSQADNVAKTVAQIKANTTPLVMPNGVPNSAISGTNYQGWRQPLANLSKSGDANSMYYGQIKNALDNEFWNQLPATADAKNLQSLRQQYANLKTLIPSVAGNSVTTEGGMVTPSLLGNKLQQAIGTEGKALGKGGLSDAVSVGNLFIGDKLPNSGTAPRSAMINLLQNAGGGAITGYGAGHFLSGDQQEGEHSSLPVELAALGAAGGAGRLLMPKIIQSIVNSPTAQNYLVNQSKSASAELAKQLARRAGMPIGTAAGMSLINQ